MENRAIAVNAVPTVSSFPRETYVRNESTLTRIGAVDQTTWNMTELNRPKKKKVKNWLSAEIKNVPTLHQPPQLLCTRILCPSDPSIFPSEEFDELKSSKKLVDDTHPLITGCQNSFLDTDCSASQEIVERPDQKEESKTCESRKTKKLVKKDGRYNNLEWRAVYEIHATDYLKDSESQDCR